MVIDKAGTLAGVKRHDFLPFGEDLASDAAWRTTARGYVGDNVRQKFTGYERDPETGLDYAQARYFASTHGRFTGTDPLLASGRVGAPQTWNRYTYALNNPLRLTDPSGMEPNEPDQGQVQNIPPRRPLDAPATPPIDRSLAGSPLYQAQVAEAATTNVTRTEGAERIFRYEDIGDGARYTGAGQQLSFTIADGNGQPLTYENGVYVTESVISPRGDTRINRNAVESDENGQINDVFGFGALRTTPGAPPSAQAIENGVRISVSTPVTHIEKHVLSVYIGGIGLVARAEYVRGMSNETYPRSGQPRPYTDSSGAYVNNYSYTLSPLTVTRPSRSGP